jgi:hypothetical protein
VTSYYLHGTTIVGFTWEADEFHPWCMPPAFAGKDADEVEEKITAYCLAIGVAPATDGDETDPRRLDSGTVPQPIFATDADCRYCGECRSGLIEGQ